MQVYRRLVILSGVLVAALCGLAWLGYHSIEMWAQGIAAVRRAEFAEVAEQIREDVKRKLDEFIQREQNRPYTDYQYYYVPADAVASQRQWSVIRSPLAGRLDHGLAYGHFQIEPDGTIISPNMGFYGPGEIQTSAALRQQVSRNEQNIRRYLLPVLKGMTASSLASSASSSRLNRLPALVGEEAAQPAGKFGSSRERESGKRPVTAGEQSKSYPIESFRNDRQPAQVIRQPRSVVASNVGRSFDPAGTASEPSLRRQSSGAVEDAQQLRQEQPGLGSQQTAASREQQPSSPEALYQRRLRRQSPLGGQGDLPGQIQAAESRAAAELSGQMDQRQRRMRSEPMDPSDARQLLAQAGETELVEICIEPFVPIVVPGGDSQSSIFSGQVFMVRHVQIEQQHFLQGFQLNEQKLMQEVEESARRFMREGMGFELRAKGWPGGASNVAYTAILDFGFGELIVDLLEAEPERIARQIGKLRNWYFSIMAVVFGVVTLGLASLWQNTRAQIKLSQKKDDFISAVSHELRTPLTSIRMYAEMLENNWVWSDEKIRQYYRNMRQESERLSRLIENVLDFSRIQRGRKRYTFRMGDINTSVRNVVETMRPYAAQSGFEIRCEFAEIGPVPFDADAVTQIVVNLLDNAIKYARAAEDKTITVRTYCRDGYVFIEVEDHGPGVPHRQRSKVFEEFYRIGSEARRETTGTGLGLALVKKFAEAHHGFVQILGAKPTGAVFRVALAVHD